MTHEGTTVPGAAYLQNTNQIDNTLIFYCANNGASGEGTPNGSVNENKFFNGYPDDLDEPWTFPDGSILGVVIDVSKEVYLDLEREAVGAMARD
jgi:hypothetical protein